MTDTAAPSLLAQLAPYLPTIGVALAVLGVLILILLALYVYKVAKSSAQSAPPPSMASPPPPPPAAEPAAAPLTADEPPVLSLEDEPVSPAGAGLGLRDVLKILGGRRYRVPWYALIGSPAAGKTAIMEAVDLGPDRIDGGAGAINEPTWWLFDDGLVVDVPGSLLMGTRQAGAAGHDGAWRRFLGRLRRVRARRPLNGLILTISAEDLIGAAALSREALLERGRDFHRRLRVAQEELGLRLPVYVVVSKCDLIHGFTSYWSAMPPERRSEMFGWSNPHALDEAYLQSWIDEVFDSLSLDIFRGQVSLSADLPVGSPKASGMVLFPAAFDRLRQPLKAMLSMVFQPTAYHESFFFRGVWFVGSLPGERDSLIASATARILGEATDDVATIASVEGAVPRPILVRHLFRRKIFAERAVARPLEGGFGTDRRDVQRMQIAAGVAAVALCGGLAWSTWSLDQNLGSLQQALTAVRDDMRQSQGNRAAQTQGEADALEDGTVAPRKVAIQQAVNAEIKLEAARALLDALGTIRTSTLGTPFIPSSWFSNAGDDIAGFLALGFEHIVLDAMELRLDQRADELIKGPLTGLRAQSGEGGRPASLSTLIRFMDALDALDSDVKRYNNLSGSDGPAELSNLVRTLMGFELPPEFSKYPDLLRSALERSGRRRFAIDRFDGAAAERLSQLVWMVLNDLTEEGELAEALRTLAGDLYKLQTGSEDPQGTLLWQVRQGTNTLNRLLSEPWWGLVADGQLRREGDITALVARMGENHFLGPRVRDRVVADVEGTLRRFQRKLAAYDSPLTGPLLVVGDSGTMTVSQPLIALSTALSTLFDKSFMAAVPAEVIPQVQGRITWDLERLKRAIGMWREYDAYLGDAMPHFPQSLRPRVQAVSEQRLTNNLLWLIAHAIQQQPVSETWRGPVESVVASDVNNLKQANESLAVLMTAFNTLGSVVQRDDLAEAAGVGAYDLLGRVDGLLSNDTLYNALSPVQMWDGMRPLTGVLFNAVDDVALQQYLAFQRERAHRLAVDYAEPALTVLATTDNGRGMAQRPLVRRWQRLFQEVDSYYQRRPGSTLVQLESFVRFTLAGLTVTDCGDKLATLGPGQASDDYFLNQKNRLLEDVWARCDELNGGTGILAGSYTRVARLFNERLAGRYPFADSLDGNGLRAATPADIKGFFAEYDMLEPGIKQELARGTMTYATRAATEQFLAQLASVRAFMAPILASKPGEPPGAYTLSVDFRVNRPFEVNANQILTWSVSVGSQTLQDPPLAPPAGSVSTPVQWRWGDPVTVRMRWAKDSPSLPFATADNRPAVEPPATAVFSYTDPWSLVTMLRQQSVQRGQFDTARRPQPNIVMFHVPTRPVTPEKADSKNQQVVRMSTSALDAAANGQVGTTAFLRFGLQPVLPPAPAGAPVAAPVETLIVPDFPVLAPVTERGGRQQGASVQPYGAPSYGNPYGGSSLAAVPATGGYPR